MAEYPTALCTEDEPTLHCSSENRISQVHLEDPTAELLGTFNISCEVLFSGEVEGEILVLNPTPLPIGGEFDYNNCSFDCTLTDLGNGSFLLLLKTAVDLAVVSADFEIRVSCPGFVACTYTGEGLSGHAISAQPPTHAGIVSFPEQNIVRLPIFGDVCFASAQLHLDLESSAPFYVRM